MINNLLVVGAGGNGRVVAEVAKSLAKWDKIAFIDDNESLRNQLILGCKVIGTIDEINTFIHTYNNIVVTVGDNLVREVILNNVKNLDIEIISVIHPSAMISESATIDIGCMIMPNTVINSQAIIGKGVIVNTSSIVEHDVRLNDFVHISPGSILAGNVTVNKSSWVGMGACIKQGVNIGEQVVVGAGAVVINDVSASATVAGIPARVITN